MRSNRGTAVQSVTKISSGASLAELEWRALQATALLKAMSNPSRLMVLCQLAEGEKSVGQLERAIGLSQSGLSQHLAVLRRERIVATRRAGQTIYYALASMEAAAVLSALYRVFCGKVRGNAADALKARPRR